MMMMMVVDQEAMDDREEILSLSDFSINTIADDALRHEDKDLFSLNSQSLDSIFYQDFEFFSHEWSFTSTTATSPNFPQENIVFCGKVILLSEEIPSISKSPLKKIEEQRPKKIEVIRSLTSRFSVDKIASFPASPREFRWYFLCGITRFRTEMGLKDIKHRQSRKNSPSTAMFGLGGGGGGKKMKKKEFECKNEGKLGMLKKLRLKSRCFSLKINGHISESFDKM